MSRVMQQQQEEEWLWEDAIYPTAWLGMLSGAKLAWDSLSRVIFCGNMPHVLHVRAKRVPLSRIFLIRAG
jgi:hypothetical protein